MLACHACHVPRPNQTTQTRTGHRYRSVRPPLRQSLSSLCTPARHGLCCPPSLCRRPNTSQPTHLATWRQATEPEGPPAEGGGGGGPFFPRGLGRPTCCSGWRGWPFLSTWAGEADLCSSRGSICFRDRFRMCSLPRSFDRLRRSVELTRRRTTTAALPRARARRIYTPLRQRRRLHRCPSDCRRCCCHILSQRPGSGHRRQGRCCLCICRFPDHAHSSSSTTKPS